MGSMDIAAAIERGRRVLQRKPASGLHDDAPAVASWQGDLRIVAQHPGGARVATDMPTELGGTGDQVSPGWLFRAGLASCLGTCIALNAATRGIALTRLEVRASSRSDTRGLLGLSDADGRPVSAAPQALELRVSLAADGVPGDRLRELVEASRRCSPIPGAVEHGTPIAVHLDLIGTAAVA